MPKLSFKLDGIDKAIASLERMKTSVGQIERLMQELCGIGMKVIIEAYSDTTGTGANAASVTWKKDKAGTYVISAQSSHLFYLEFGAGIAKNGSGSYPIARPPGIGGIGSQVAGHGNQPSWFYPDSASPTGYSYTTGTAAKAAYPEAYEAMVQALPGLVKKYFN
jgi:hypothetical protein